MPEIQCIPDDEDRLFYTTLGNWTGEAEFQTFIDGLVTCACFVLDPGETQKTEQLAYPNIKPQPGKKHTFVFCGAKAGDDQPCNIHYNLTDGNYSFQGDLPFEPSNDPNVYQTTIDIPQDFNPNAASLIMTGSQEVGTFINFIAFKNVYLTYTTQRPQCLPIMGVG
jgi:hypothetical protein